MEDLEVSIRDGFGPGPREAGAKAKLDRALRNPVQWEMFLPMARSWNKMTFKVPSNPNDSGILSEPSQRCFTGLLKCGSIRAAHFGAKVKNYK